MKILYIEACNYINFPVGGQLTFARQMLQAFGNELSLVGISTDDTPVGKWLKKEINGIQYNYFAIHKAKIIDSKPLVPRRLQTYLALKKYKHKILDIAYDHAFCNAPEVLMATRHWQINNMIYYFSGMNNPLSISRRWYGRLFAGLFNPLFIPALKGVKHILAAGDAENIEKTILDSNGLLKSGDIIQFPSRIDTEIFKNRDKLSCRKELGLPSDKTIITTTGRLHWAKGWKLMLDAFKEFLKTYPEGQFHFIGDGGDRSDIMEYIQKEKLTDQVFLAGFQSHYTLARYLNASDLFVMGSYAEGWATSLVEAKGCGVPICTTNFSSAKDIVEDGKAGYVVKDRDIKNFVKAMQKALALKIDVESLPTEMQRYSIYQLREDLEVYLPTTEPVIA